jgi:threonine aldolase
MDFRSDNVHGASPEVLQAIARAAAGTQTSYGGDELTERVRRRCSEVFQTDVDIIPVVTGSAANSIAISALTPPWGAVLCHPHAHIYRDEWNAPEFFTGGARVFPVPSQRGTLTVDEITAVVRGADFDYMAVPSCVSLTNASEAGTLYRPDEVRAIREALPQSIRMHMDGARFANAIAALGCSPADLTWRAGIDLLSFGATKNGALTAELIVVFNNAVLAAEVRHRARRAGQRLSKMRFLSAQFEAMFENDLWLRNAQRANALAARLARSVDPIQPVQANIVFLRLSDEKAAALRGAGFRFGEWGAYGKGAYRFVMSFDSAEADVDALTAALR